MDSAGRTNYVMRGDYSAYHGNIVKKLGIYDRARHPKFGKR